MNDAGILIIGAGQAGYQLAVSLRDAGYDKRVVLIGDEPDLPYQRPPLSKAFQSGDCEAEQVTFQKEPFYEGRRIELMLGVRVLHIDRERHHISTGDGRRIEYEHLVLATGARNRLLPGWDSATSGLLKLRTLHDAHALREALNRSKRAVIVGAGFLGLEFAAVAAKRGVAVSVIEASSNLMSRAVSAPVAEAFREHHESLGVTFSFDSGVKRICTEAGRVIGAETTGGMLHEADLVVVSIGVVPNVELAKDAGLEIANGIVVDLNLATSDPSISALGDCAAFPSRFAFGNCRIESVQNAVDQARFLAQRLTGHTHGFEAVPWFWSDQGGVKLQIAGVAMSRPDEIVLRGDRAGLKFSAYGFAKGHLVAVESVNRPADHIAARKLLAADAPVTPAQAADPQFDLKTVLQPVT
ncbi:FAD-dependent pyridine nucleotide-disulfide oxidoreductase [Caballeronia terrestris]|uniref:FAD-dependent pyridine nucleotide-disulfide oxidoreductase n=1 Tax=Caballeronia terrestris TaxID=1226301 RepID=A0A158KCS4_9BURK|nr:FAD-dependent oxidoreductase [Caballeronia terrestris]SAL78845.1 FAD-dependent pyridine nucleotide-disulfide oxidoreductase [Caballeronia terrestris]